MYVLEVPMIKNRGWISGFSAKKGLFNETVENKMIGGGDSLDYFE